MSQYILFGSVLILVFFLNKSLKRQVEQTAWLRRWTSSPCPDRRRRIPRGADPEAPAWSAIPAWSWPGRCRMPSGKTRWRSLFLLPGLNSNRKCRWRCSGCCCRYCCFRRWRSARFGFRGCFEDVLFGLLKNQPLRNITKCNNRSVI